MDELKGKNKATAHDIRVFTTQEMTLASNLRSITDTFRQQANRFRQRLYCFFIKTTRLDKGRDVVLINKSKYLLKILFKEKSITEQFYKMAFPESSNPGRLYGLPKVHKNNISL
ncbi:unnamed protein product [Adineta steineri]|uniref:Uncharacterized protein n=1 Tax=Adineta steineri TaxID=433720 RepID=A0A814SI01_9BILA|nr:unnamed protein product [Adineta steineri]CAF1148349.1 unnamed protein product [Adineta steineri]